MYVNVKIKNILHSGTWVIPIRIKLFLLYEFTFLWPFWSFMERDCCY